MRLKLIILAIAICSAAHTAEACSCDLRDTVEEYVEEADAAYVGTVISSRPISFGIGPGSELQVPGYETRIRI